jgi:hypothetical protein
VRQATEEPAVIDEREMRQLGKRALDPANFQAYLDAVIPRGRPGALPMGLNQQTQRRIGHFQLLDTYRGSWTDLNTGAGGEDLVDLICFVADREHDPDARQRAAVILRQFLDSLPPPMTSPLRPNVTRTETARLPPKVRSIPGLVGA